MNHQEFNGDFDKSCQLADSSTYAYRNMRQGRGLLDYPRVLEQMWRLTPFRIVPQKQGHSEIRARVKGPLVTVRLFSTQLNKNTRGALADIKKLGSRNTCQQEKREETAGRSQCDINVHKTSQCTKANTFKCVTT